MPPQDSPLGEPDAGSPRSKEPIQLLWRRRTTSADLKVHDALDLPVFNMWKRNLAKVNSWVLEIVNVGDSLPLFPEEEDQDIWPKDPTDGPFNGVPNIAFTEDYWTRLWDSSLRGKQSLGYDENTRRDDFGKEQRCRNCRCMFL